jgi:hypothetical protein
MQSNSSTERFELTQEAFAALGGPKTVYIKEMAPSEIADLPGLPEEFVQTAGAIKLYSVHAIDGTRVAVVDNRDAAFLAARQNEMEPVSVH